MRIVLKENKQRELIEREREKFGSLPKLASNLRIKTGKLCGYYYDGSLIPEEIFNKFSLKEEYQKYIIDKKENNWGQSKGGLVSKGNTKEINNPKESIELAELYGIMLGDGNLSSRKGHKIGTYQIRIVGDSRKDKDYLLNYVKPLIENLFSIEVAISKQKNTNALYLTCTGRKLVEFLEGKGFKPGDKIRNQLEIPNWIKLNSEFLRKCLRGLYDTDGSAYKLTNQNSYQICFTNYNKLLINDVRNSLVFLGISPSQITKGRDLLITKKSELRKFLKEVGFSNAKHSDKIRTWNI